MVLLVLVGKELNRIDYLSVLILRFKTISIVPLKSSHRISNTSAAVRTKRCVVDVVSELGRDLGKEMPARIRPLTWWILKVTQSGGEGSGEGLTKSG